MESGNQNFFLTLVRDKWTLTFKIIVKLVILFKQLSTTRFCTLKSLFSQQWLSTLARLTVGLLFRSTRNKVMTRFLWTEIGWMSWTIEQARRLHACYSNQTCHSTLSDMEQWKSTLISRTSLRKRNTSFFSILRCFYTTTRYVQDCCTFLFLLDFSLYTLA